MAVLQCFLGFVACAERLSVMPWAQQRARVCPGGVPDAVFLSVKFGKFFAHSVKRFGGAPFFQIKFVLPCSCEFERLWMGLAGFRTERRSSL